MDTLQPLLISGGKIIHIYMRLGLGQVSGLGGCPHFGGDLKEKFHGLLVLVPCTRKFLREHSVSL